jgi:hypothetical protein
MMIVNQTIFLLVNHLFIASTPDNMGQLHWFIYNEGINRGYDGGCLLAFKQQTNVF